MRRAIFLVGHGALTVERAIWNGHVSTPKTDAGERRFTISPILLECLRAMAEFHKPEDYLFATKKGTPLQLNNALNRHLHPLLKQLSIPQGGFHAFRHGNASLTASLGAPAPVKKDRLGHTSSLVTDRYEHALSADHVRVSREIGNLLTSRPATAAEASQGEQSAMRNNHSLLKLAHGKRQDKLEQASSVVSGGKIDHIARRGA